MRIPLKMGARRASVTPNVCARPTEGGFDECAWRVSVCVFMEIERADKCGNELPN